MSNINSLNKILNKILSKILNKEFILYLVFGVLTTLIDTFVFLIANYKFEINYLISNCIAWVLAVLFAYVTSKLFVFKAKNKSILENLKEMFYFFSLRFVSLIVSLVFMYITIEIFLLNELITKLFSSVFVVIVNYIFNKFYIFKNK